jgi:hypothetical protein
MKPPNDTASLSLAIEDFLDVRDEALRAFQERKHASERELQSPYALAQFHYWLVAIGGYLLGIVVLVPPLGRQLAAVVLPQPPWLTFVGALIIWTLLIAPISGWIRRISCQRTWLLLCYTLVGVPLILALGESFVRDDWNGFLQRMVTLPLFSLVLLLVLLAILLMTGSSIPQILFLLVTSVRSGRGGKVFPSYEILVRDILVALEQATTKHSRSQLEGIAAIAQQKQTGLDVRTQTLGLVFTAFALLGLLQLTVASEDVAAGLDGLFEGITRLIGLSASTPNSVNSVPVILVVLFGLVIAGLYYGTAAYLELRILEVINLFCSLRLQDQQIIGLPRMSGASGGSTTPADAQAYWGAAGLLVGVTLGIFGVVLFLYQLVRRLITSRW